MHPARPKHVYSCSSRYARRAAGCLALGIAGCGVCAAVDNLDYTAEHLIEVQMDARYLALPEITSSYENTENRFDIGFLRADSDTLNSKMIMTGLQHYRPASDDQRWGYLFGGFLDVVVIDGGSGNAFINTDYAQTTPFTTPLNIYQRSASGHALHAGVSAAITHRGSDRWAWQTGLALEYYAVNTFSVDFSTRDLAANYNGKLDYSSRYNSITPFLGFRYFYPEQTSGYTFSSRLLLAWPQPRRGFSGNVSGPGYAVGGNTDAAGHGRHIPDPFAGIGLSIESRQRGWRLDIGTSLWMLLVETRAHEGINPPLFIHINWPLQ